MTFRNILSSTERETLSFARPAPENRMSQQQHSR